jgi:hypothetical protein
MDEEILQGEVAAADRRIRIVGDLQNQTTGRVQRAACHISGRTSQVATSMQGIGSTSRNSSACLYGIINSITVKDDIVLSDKAWSDLGSRHGVTWHLSEHGAIDASKSASGALWTWGASASMPGEA